MNGKDSRWIDKWSKQKFGRLYPDFYVFGYGTNSEPGTSCWMATLLDPLGSRFCEGINLLDYGCGCARLFNFMTGYLQNFRYFGAEPEGSREIEIAKRYFRQDPRTKFMSCDEAVISEDAMNSDAVILGSIFTHLLPETCEEILKKLLPVTNKGGIIIFTALLKPQAEARGPGAHGFANCYGVSFQSEAWIGELEAKFACKIEYADDFEAGVNHKIFRIGP